ncbi:MAG: hypothetical protein JSV19_08545 [Phycisphaerales bacterium]|nr:MAG: hypothetical protein JSV19_08545 [Phycisphaerales bacterium]
MNGKRKDSEYDLFIGTREQIALQSDENGHESVPRGPPWDAHLADVQGRAFRLFEANRKQDVGVLLLA